MSEIATASKYNGKRRRGRPRTGRVPLALRVTPEIKARVEAMAGVGNRSQSQVAELMLEKAFLIEDLLRARLISARVPAVGVETDQ
jgi:hypothetical protein